MKKFVLIIIIILFITSACSPQNNFQSVPRAANVHIPYRLYDGVRIFEVDFIEKYYETLNVMFDNDWTIVSAEERFDENEGYICGCGFDGRSQQFIAWTIEYTDGIGDVRHFVLTNRATLNGQIRRYLETYIAQHFEENFFNVYITDTPLAPSSLVFARWVDNFVRTYPTDDFEQIARMEEIAQNFLRGLNTPDGTIQLSRLTPSNVFEMAPIYLLISVSLAGYSGLGKELEIEVMQKIEDMTLSMNKFTNNTLNADIRFGYHQIIDLHIGNRQYRQSYIHGEQRIGIGGMNFGRYVFESYRGVFW